MSARILIVEDHADLRHLIRMMLEFDGYEIYEASDASEGLEMVHRVRPDLLVLDIMLPGGMNGLDLCRLLKTALLHKSEGRRDYPSPRRSYAMAPTGTVLGRPSCVKRLSRATRTCNSTT